MQLNKLLKVPQLFHDVFLLQIELRVARLEKRCSRKGLLLISVRRRSQALLDWYHWRPRQNILLRLDGWSDQFALIIVIWLRGHFIFTRLYNGPSRLLNIYLTQLIKVTAYRGFDFWFNCSIGSGQMGRKRIHTPDNQHSHLARFDFFAFHFFRLW